MQVSAAPRLDFYVCQTHERISANLEFAPRKLVKALTVARCGEGIHLTGREAEALVFSHG